jgi:hypothetical protein
MCLHKLNMIFGGVEKGRRKEAVGRGSVIGMEWIEETHILRYKSSLSLARHRRNLRNEITKVLSYLLIGIFYNRNMIV